MGLEICRTAGLAANTVINMYGMNSDGVITHHAQFFGGSRRQEWALRSGEQLVLQLQVLRMYKMNKNAVFTHCLQFFRGQETDIGLEICSAAGLAAKQVVILLEQLAGRSCKTTF